MACKNWDDFIERCKLGFECWYSDNWETGAESCHRYEEKE